MEPFSLIVSSELPRKQPSMTGPSMTGGSHMLAPPPAPYTHLPPHSNSTPAPSHQYQANHQPIGWVHDPILRDNYGAATQVPITDANAQQNLPAEARILFGNLPMNCDPEVLRDQLKGGFSYFGLNWVHIENRCKHTVAFVQFYNFQQADQAIAYNQGINYHGRPLRIELSKAGRIRRNKIVEYFQSLPHSFPD